MTDEETMRLLYDAYAALRELHMAYGLDESYPVIATETFERLGDILFSESLEGEEI